MSQSDSALPKVVYMHLAATVPLSQDVCDRLTSQALQSMYLDETFRAIIDMVERENIPIVRSNGVASSRDYLDSFAAWLETQGVSMKDVQPVLGKKVFAFAADAQEPAGGKFNWSLLVYVL